MDNLLDATVEYRHLTLLQFEGIILGFAQTQILSIDRHPGRSRQTPTGLPIFALDHELALWNQVVSDHQFCVAIKHPDHHQSFALMCHIVDQYDIEDDVSISTMPAILYNPDSPIIGMVKQNTKLVLITSAELMRTYINSREIEYAYPG